MPSVWTTVLQSILFFSPQFYCYPWKPLINSIYGDSYQVAVKHFLQNHLTAPNLALHGVCMIVQLVGNFCFLLVIDMALFPNMPRVLSITTSLCWIIYLHLNSSEAPKWGQIASTISILGAQWTAPFLLPHGETISIVLLAAFDIVLLLLILLGYHKQLNIKAAILSTIVLLVVHTIWHFIPQDAGDVVRPYTFQLNVLFVSILLILSMVKNPVGPTVAFGYLVGRTLATLTDQPWLFYFSFGFFGSVLQGISHLVTSEIPTLIALQNETPQDKIRYEYAHVIYFPNLVFEGVDYYYHAACKRKNKFV